MQHRAGGEAAASTRVIAVQQGVQILLLQPWTSFDEPTVLTTYSSSLHLVACLVSPYLAFASCEFRCDAMVASFAIAAARLTLAPFRQQSQSQLR